MTDKIKIDALCFDFDGTLGMTETELRNAWKKTIAHLDLSCPDFENIYRVGPSLQDMSAALFPGKSPDELSLIQAAFRHFYDDSEMKSSPPYPWCGEILQELEARGKKLYVVTNKRLKPLKKTLAHFGFGHRFAGIFSPDICPRCEVLTKPELLLLAVRCANIPPENVMMVGDTELDINAAHEVNCRSCGVTWGYGSIEMLEKSAPDIIVDSDNFFRKFDENFL